MKKTLCTIAVLLLTVLILVLPAYATDNSAEEEIHILACSDFQASSGNASGIKRKCKWQTTGERHS